MEKLREVDLIVIGAGWHGLAAAKTYLELNPSANIVIYESESTLGGVWSKERLYPGLKSNNMLGTYEYSDFPMDTETYGVQLGEHIPGHVIHRYLTNYAEKFGFFRKIQFETKVESAEHIESGGWLLTVSRATRGRATFDKSQIFASKLIVATGLTSEPSIAKFSGSDSFGVPLFHSRDFLNYAESLDTSERVCIFGGTKSAWDAVYTYASKGIKVDWVIRESGHGPTWMAPPYVTPLKKWLEKLVHTRLLTWFSPCIWGDADGYTGIRSFLHGSRIGRFIVNTFWGILGNDVITLNKYDSHADTAKLKPWSNPMFIASGLSILNYDTDFFDLVKSGIVKVHIADITSLSPKRVHLSNGEELATDALVCCTGWKRTPPLTFLPSGLDLGIPHKPSTSDPVALTLKADKEILNRFPRLKDQPAPNPKAKSLPIINPEEGLTPYNLYRFMIPASTTKNQDIAFAGSVMSISTTLLAQIQALWICAYFNSSLSLPTGADMAYEAILYNRFGKWRYPAGFGDKFPDFVFDALPYVDLLLKDLGLKRWRKGSALKEILQPYGPEDYKDLVGEWMALRGSEGKKDL